MNLLPIMKKKWWTIPSLQKELKKRGQYMMETTISARIRDLRKDGHTVIKEHIKNGLWKYKVMS